MDERVLARFVQDGRLVVVPTKRSKMLVVLDHLAQDFELGRTYPEAAVAETLERYHPDHAMLRRALVDEGFMTRDGGVYWRSGGTAEV